MLDKNWRMLFREETQMDVAGSRIRAFVIFGGVFGLCALYVLDTRAQLESIAKAMISLSVMVLLAALAAQWRWARILSEAAVCLLTVIWMIRPFVAG